LRAVLFYAFVTATPSFLACQFLPYGGIFKVDKFTFSLFFGVGFCSLIIEPISKVNSYVGYFTPKAIEILINILVRRRVINWSERRTIMLIFVASGLLGLAASRGHNKRAAPTPRAQPVESTKPTEDTPKPTTQKSKDEEKVFDGPLGFLVN